MLGKGVRFSRFECGEFEFPQEVNPKDIEITNERHFIEFILRNDWVQRKIGVKCTNSTGLFPDLIGEIYDEIGGTIKVEVEFWAENYILHGHKFGGCDLIISFFRHPTTRFIKGIPVWSFYKGKKKGNYFEYCFEEDMHYDFANHHLIEEPNVPYGISSISPIRKLL